MKKVFIAIEVGDENNFDESLEFYFIFYFHRAHSKSQIFDSIHNLKR